MYSILISLFSGALAGYALRYTESSSSGWAVFWGATVAVAVYAGISLVLRKALMKRMTDVQNIIVEGQQQLMKRAQMM